MKTFLAQLAFDGKRLVVRNVSFIFFSLKSWQVDPQRKSSNSISLTWAR